MSVKVLFLLGLDRISVVSVLIDGVDETYTASYEEVEKDLIALGLTISQDACLFHTSEVGMYFQQVWSA